MGGGRERTENLGLADMNYYIRMNKQQGPTDNTGNYIQHPVINHNKENVVHIYNGILLSHKKEQNNAICSNMDATRGYHTK